ncbi:hypothetical protein KQI84_17760 [bacterium]|nr:hypothetical protein [bacterium]
MRIPAGVGVLITLLVLAGCVSSGGGKSSVTVDDLPTIPPRPAWSEAAEQKAEEIARELEGLADHPWAGKYDAGVSLSAHWTLLVAPKSGFVFSQRSCSGMDAQNWGRVTESDGRLHLLGDDSIAESNKLNLPTELILVPWGERVYAIPERQMPAFCSWVNAGLEPRTKENGDALLREGGLKKPATGKPTLPARYLPWLLDAPIVTRVINVGDVSTRETPSTCTNRDTAVRIDAGTKDGAFEGMILYPVDPPGEGPVRASHVYTTSYAIVLVAEESESLAMIREECVSTPPPAVGWKLSTAPAPKN